MVGRVRRASSTRTLIFAGVMLTLVSCAARSVQLQASTAQSLNDVGLTQYSTATRPVAASIAGTTLTGAELSLSDMIGDVVVLNVWASWCGPCRSESPALASASVHFTGQPVRFIGIDERDASREAKAFVASAGARYPDLVDSDGKLLNELRLLPQAAVPSTLVLDRHGRVADRVIGAVTQPEITRLIAALLTEP